jgi:hypothetical protein
MNGTIKNTKMSDKIDLTIIRMIWLIIGVINGNKREIKFATTRIAKLDAIKIMMARRCLSASIKKRLSNVIYKICGVHHIRVENEYKLDEKVSGYFTDLKSIDDQVGTLSHYL